jgi:ribosomal protein S18 acetylase RimI-like enzyme
MLEWAESHAREASERSPEGARVTMQGDAVSSYAPANELLEGYGMTLMRHFWRMEIELDEPPPVSTLPEGIRIITFAEMPDGLAVYRVDVEAFADHFGHVPQEEESGYKRFRHFTIEDDEFDPTLWFLAMDGDEIAGISLCWHKDNEDPDMGWVSTLGVRRPWRRQGLALALLYHSFGEFYRRGKPRAGLGVDAASLTGATRLYEKAGMHVSRQFDAYEKVLRDGKDLVLREL